MWEQMSALPVIAARATTLATASCLQTWTARVQRVEARRDGGQGRERIGSNSSALDPPSPPKKGTWEGQKNEGGRSRFRVRGTSSGHGVSSFVAGDGDSGLLERWC